MTPRKPGKTQRGRPGNKGALFDVVSSSEPPPAQDELFPSPVTVAALQTFQASIRAHSNGGAFEDWAALQCQLHRELGLPPWRWPYVAVPSGCKREDLLPVMTPAEFKLCRDRYDALHAMLRLRQ
jgi:hypothetical protein